MPGMLTNDLQTCERFTECPAASPLGMALGNTPVDVVDPELCNLVIPPETELFPCPLDTPMAGAVVTDLLLCQAPNDENKCPAETDLEGVYVMDTASDCTIFEECNAGSPLGMALGDQPVKVADSTLCELDVPEIQLFQCMGGPMEGAVVTDQMLCEAPNSANKCPNEGVDLPGVYVMNPQTQCNIDIPEPPIECPESGFLVNDDVNCPQKCPDGTYIMQGMECPTITGELNVTKVFEGCFLPTDDGIDCEAGEGVIVPSSASDFTINVTGNNANPPSFPGDETGTIVTMEDGAYEVTEQGITSVVPEVCTDLLGNTINAGTVLPQDDNQFICTTFSEDCDGNIEAGQELTCIIQNTVLVPAL
ncbi:MAG: hypothetical protein ACPKPY_01455 [Nitrososphaeraceae archaeon]